MTAKRKPKTLPGVQVHRLVSHPNLVTLLGEAMDEVWGDYVGDINEIPACFKIHGKAQVSANFKDSLFAYSVARRLEWLVTNT
jgi:hypothetical protein